MGIRLVLVDDHSTFRRHMRVFLEARGFRVVGEASNGEQAERLVRRLHPDIALLDLSMPGIDGFETARRIAGLRPRTRTIALTARREPADIEAALKAGASGFVVKSRAADELVQALRQVAAGKPYVPSGLR